MKNLSFKTQKGFTLIEILIVAAMVGFVMAAMYSIYSAHQRTAYTSDETVEVQQNIRIALDSISRDIRIAGFLLPRGSTPISAATPTAITIGLSNSGSVISKITPSPSPQLGTASTNSFTVDDDNSWTAFNKDDYVRIFRPLDRTQPKKDTEPAGTDRVYKVVSKPTTNNIQLTDVTGGDPVNVNFITGDLIIKVSSVLSPPPPNTIQYVLGDSGTDPTCPSGQQCLIRVDENGTRNVVAQNLAPNGLQFQYLLDKYPLPNETNAPASTDLIAIRAVRVTITGQTAQTVAFSGNQPKTRQMQTLIQIRNR